MFKLPAQAQSLESIRRTRPGRSPLWLALLLGLAVLGTVAGLRWIPWMQSVTAQGKVSFFAPTRRPQDVDAQIPGRIQAWYVTEGQTVRKGQKLALLQDIDAKFLVADQAARLREVLDAYDQKWRTAQMRAETIQEQMEALEQVRGAALPAARERVTQSQRRVQQAHQTLLQAEQNRTTDNMQYDRLRQLAAEGLRSRRDLELAEQARLRSLTELDKTRKALQISRQDVDIARLEERRLGASLSNDMAKLQESYLKARETIAEVEAERRKLAIDVGNVEARRLQQVVVAPCNGKVVRLLAPGLGETAKVGDALCRIVPEASQPCAELYVTGSDAPLVRKGMKVRLMFDGFPAVPFTGWPWASYGTFGGQVQVVDAMDDGKAQYRLLVTPTLEHGDQPWPPAQENDDPQSGWVLRPGTQARGWIMMEKPVPLYWEVWRRLNAFPPVPSDLPVEGKKDKQAQPKPVLKR